ncbi:MAG TPA: single-stranded-DNA-specific exonuclease RecJ [Steroidobacteraceae bacterium]|nr:single-stranded-DNA-specific exonuclease RecJ [Steroidobacteraceae bacterium]
MTLEIRRRPHDGMLESLRDLHPVLKRIYGARGVSGADDLDLSLERLLPVSTLDGVERAAELLAAHRVSGRVLVVGDFDADGATGSALLVRALRALGFAHVDFLVPNRFQFGYGLTPGIVTLAEQRRPSLIVTVDNGVSSVEGVQAARALGIQVLITDHHLPGARLPAAEAIVNPNLAGSAFSSPALSGVGVAFYVIAALARSLSVPQFRPAELLDLVALGTVADLVPLDRNNRVLVAQGLKRIRAGRCTPGIRALLESAGRPLERVTAADLGFAVAPRLNAAGRLSDMSVGIECLLADDDARARALAAQLTRLNEERREIEQRMQIEAAELAAGVRFADPGGETLGLCLFDESWHQGVVGLVAGRIKDRLHRPVIAFARAQDGSLRGSARSVAGIHIRDVLDTVAAKHPGLIEKFGGHAMAAGMTLPAPNLESFRRAFAAEVAARADAEALAGVILSDGPLFAAELSLDTARMLRGAGPWGQGFPEPMFDGTFKIADLRVVGGRHLKMRLQEARSSPTASDADGRLEAIAFGYVGGASEDPALERGAAVDLVYRLEVNEYNGAEQLQLNCQHLALRRENL